MGHCPKCLASEFKNFFLSVEKSHLFRYSRYGFRLHKLPMLLKAPFDTTFYIDSDIYACCPTVIEDLIREMAAETKTDVFCIREDIRRVDKVNI